MRLEFLKEIITATYTSAGSSITDSLVNPRKFPSALDGSTLDTLLISGGEWKRVETKR